MLIAAGLAMIIAGFVLRDLRTADFQPQMRRWLAAWHHVSTYAVTGAELGDPSTIAEMIANPDTPDAVLDVLADDIASNEWIPSGALLDQLRNWARTQRVAEQALEARTAPTASPHTQLDTRNGDIR